MKTKETKLHARAAASVPAAEEKKTLKMRERLNNKRSEAELFKFSEGVG
jgi:hypothetical protein